MSTGRIGRAWRTLREEGLRSFWFKLVDVLGYRRLFLLSRSLAEPITPVEAKLPLTMTWLTTAETAEYLQFRPTTDPIRLTARFARHERCLVARTTAARIVGTMWVATEVAWIEYLGRELALAADEAYLFDAFTDPAMRGQAIAPALSAELLRRLRKEGCRRALRCTLPENAAALRAHAKAGFQIVARMGRVQCGPWRRDWRSA